MYGLLSFPLENSKGPDQLASLEASCSGSTVFFIHTTNPYRK